MTGKMVILDGSILGKTPKVKGLGLELDERAFGLPLSLADATFLLHLLSNKLPAHEKYLH